MRLDFAKYASTALLIVGFAVAGPIGDSSHYNSGGYVNTKYIPNPIIYSKDKQPSYYGFSSSNYKGETTMYYPTQRPYSPTSLPYSLKDRYPQSKYPTTTSSSLYYPNSYSQKIYKYLSSTPLHVYYPLPQSDGYLPSTQRPLYTQKSSYYKPANPAHVLYPTPVHPSSAYHSIFKGSPVYSQPAYVTKAYTTTSSTFNKPAAGTYLHSYQQPVYSASTTPGSYYQFDTSYTTTPAYQYEQQYPQSSYTQSPYASSTEAPAYQSQKNYYTTSTEGHQAYYQKQAPYPKAGPVYETHEEADYSNQNLQEKYHESVTEMEYRYEEKPAYDNS